VPLTVIALDAEPDSVRGKDFFPHPQEHHANYPAGIEFLVDICNRAACSAEATGETKLNIFAARLIGNNVLELGIEFTQSYSHFRLLNSYSGEES
jgi:hypothetical protein